MKGDQASPSFDLLRPGLNRGVVQLATIALPILPTEKSRERPLGTLYLVGVAASRIRCLKSAKRRRKRQGAGLAPETVRDAGLEWGSPARQARSEQAAAARVLPSPPRAGGARRLQDPLECRP